MAQQGNAHGLRGDLVLADGLERAPVAGGDQQRDEHDHGERDAIAPPDVGRLGDGLEALRAVGDALCVGDEDADDLGKAERRDGEVVAAQAQAGQADEERHARRQQPADDQRDAEGQGQRVKRRDERLEHEDGFLLGDGDGQQGDAVCADRHEARVPQRKNAGEALHEVHGECEHDVDGAKARDADDVTARVAVDIGQHPAKQQKEQAGQDDRAFLHFGHGFTPSPLFFRRAGRSA